MVILRSVRQSFVLGVAAGATAGLLLPRPGPSMLRPMTKGAVKAAMLALQTSKERLASLGEAISDAVAEARHEYATGGEGESENGVAADAS
jgi:hypothetical protein